MKALVHDPLLVISHVDWASIVGLEIMSLWRSVTWNTGGGEVWFSIIKLMAFENHNTKYELYDAFLKILIDK